ncbi:MAG: hypothetical protein V1818_02125 [Candidatus Aenigmatarchaeota archaeon]
MVNVKKFLLIPVLIIAYVLFINFISQIPASVSQVSQSMSGGTAQTLGMGDIVSVSVSRTYFFGTVRLPVYSALFGEIGIFHEIFSYFIMILTVIFIIQEVKYNKKRRGEKMAKKSSNFDWKKIVMPIVWGMLFTLLAYILSGDASSIVIGLLVMYLEYKLRK